MKIRFLLLLAIASTATTSISSAQNRFGIIAGSNFGSLAVTADEKSGTKSGFAGGFFYETDLGGNAFFHTGALYVEKGGIVRSEGFETKLSYVDLTTMLKFVLADKHSSLRPYFQGGISLGLLASARIIDGYSSLDSSMLFKESDFGFVGGAGFQVGDSFHIEGRYIAGFVSAAQEVLPFEIKNQGFQILAGFSTKVR